MLSIALIGNLVSLKFRKNIQKIIPYMLVIMAVLFILRGMNLGVPYISPKLIQDNLGVVTPVCH
jgi:hypothetical protein